MKEIDSKGIYLLPNKFNIIGVLLFVVGIIITIIRFYFGVKPDWLDIKVFAVYSSFLQTKYFTFITNNILEELSGLILLVGLVFIAFSKEKTENEIIEQIRIRSFFYSVYINILFTVFAFIFIFGLGFVYYLVLNMFVFLLLFIFIFRYNIYYYKKIKRNN